MDLLDSIRILMKRWWLTLPLLLITLGGVVTGAVMLPWKYKSEATVVFISSQLLAKQTGGNPWLAFDSSLTVTAEVVGREIMDEGTSAALRKQGDSADYKVGVAADSTGPVLVIEVEGATPEVTQNTLEAVLRQVPIRLDDIQSQGGVAENARIRPSTVSTSTQSQRVAKDKIRTLVMGLFAGLVVSIGLPLLAESLTSRRRQVLLYDTDASPAAGLDARAGPANGRHRSELAEWTPYMPPEPDEEPRHGHPPRDDPRRADPRHGDPRR
jgi:capsular polysaccharide biosynthesis protein